MKATLKKSWLVVAGFLCVFHLIVYLLHRNRAIIDKDLFVWKSQYQIPYSLIGVIIYLLWWHREFRNLFYYRTKPYGRILNLILPKLSGLYLNAKYIGPGFFIQHGDSSRINGEYIGSNCWVNQLVTIAYSNRFDRPTLMDGVKVHVGAIILGKVTIGENSIIGAGSVIVKNVPPNCTVVGSYPTFIIKENGMPVRRQL